jgi:hypothetical protein
MLANSVVQNSIKNKLYLYQIKIKFAIVPAIVHGIRQVNLKDVTYKVIVIPDISLYSKTRYYECFFEIKSQNRNNSCLVKNE